MISQETLINCCRRITRWPLYGIVFLVPIFFAWLQENFSVFDLNKSLLLHFLLGMGLIAWLVEITLSGEVKFRGNRLLFGLGCIVSTVFLMSTVFSVYPTISLWGSYERVQGLYSLWTYITFSFLMIVTLRNRTELRYFINALLLGSAISVLYGLIQLFGLDFLRWGEKTDRLFSSFGQPNFFGHYLAVLLPITFYAIFYYGKNVFQRFGYILLFLAQATCLVFTYSRGAWLALLIALFIFTVWWLWRRQHKVWAIGLLGLALAGLIMISFSGVRNNIIQSKIFGDGKLVERVFSVFVFNTGSNRIRLLYWQSGFQAWQEAPWERKILGYGPDAETSVYIRYYRPTWAYDEQMNSFPDRAHNFVIDILLQFGLIGLLALSALLGYIAWRLYRYSVGQADKEEFWLGVSVLLALLIYGLNNLFSFSLVSMNVVFYGLLGTAWLVAYQFKEEKISVGFFQPLSRRLITGAVSIFLLVIFYNYSVKLYIADYHYFEVKKAEVRGDCAAMLDGMDTVVRWYPLSAFYNRQYLHHGTNCFSSLNSEADYQQLGKSLAEHLNALPPEENQFYTLIDLSHTYSILGFYVDKKYYEEAEKIYQQMLSLSPYITTTYQDYGRMKLWQQKSEEAIAIFKKGIEVIPPLEEAKIEAHRTDIVEQLGYFKTLIGMAYVNKGDSQSAIQWYKEALATDAKQTAAYKNLADIYYQLGDIKTAIEYNEKASRIDKENNLWFFNLGLLYKEQGNITAARKYAQEALRLSPEDQKIKDLVKELESNSLRKQ